MDVLATADDGRFRVGIVCYDAYGDEPYNDGGSPILRYEYRGGWVVEQVDKITSYVLPAEIIGALSRWGSDTELFERYLRIFHGTTAIKWEDPHRSGPHYVTFDTAHWRNAMEITDEYMAAHPEHFGDGQLANMDEYVAYVQGETYGYIVEEKVIWRRVDSVTDEHDDVRATWEEVDSCYGFYGETDYLKEAAIEAMNAAAQAAAQEDTP